MHTDPRLLAIDLIPIEAFIAQVKEEIASLQRMCDAFESTVSEQESALAETRFLLSRTASMRDALREFVDLFESPAKSGEIPF